jgi:hypothetical protein
MTPHYCSTGWSLYHKLAETFMNFETGEQYSGEMFDHEKHTACVAKLGEHFQTCAQCYLADLKKPPAPVRL